MIPKRTVFLSTKAYEGRDILFNIFAKNFQNELSDSIMDIENTELVLPIKYTREGLEEILHV